MSTQKFVEILFPDELQPDDLAIITPARAEQPGRARLIQARNGQPHPAAPHSAPPLSRTGAKIGFVAPADLIEPPYTNCYWLAEEPEQAD